MGSSPPPPPKYRYICPHGSEHSGTTTTRNYVNCNWCWAYYRKDGRSCRRHYQNYCNNGYASTPDPNWTRQHKCSSCHSTFYVVYAYQCFPRTQLGGPYYGSSAPLQYLKNRNTLSSYYYIKFLTGHSAYTSYIPPIGVYVESNNKYWVEINHLKLGSSSTSLWNQYTLPSYDSTWTVNVRLYNANSNYMWSSSNWFYSTLTITCETKNFTVKKYNGPWPVSWSNEGTRTFVRVTSPYDFLEGAMGSYCYGIYITNAKRSTYPRHIAQEGYTYLAKRSYNGKHGSYEIKADWNNGYWAEGKNHVTSHSWADYYFHSDSKYLEDKPKHAMAEFFRTHTRTTPMLPSVYRNRLMGVIDTGNEATDWTEEYGTTRYYISYDLLKDYWRDKFPLYCSGPTGTSGKYKCPPGINVKYMDVRLAVYDYTLGTLNQSANHGQKYQGIPSHVPKDDDKLLLDTIDYINVRLVLEDKDIYKNAPKYDYTQQTKNLRYNQTERTRVVYFQVHPDDSSKFNENKIFRIDDNTVVVEPEPCPPYYITTNKDDYYSECTQCQNTKTNFYTFSDTTTGNQNTCHDFNNIVSLPGKYLVMNNGRLVNVNLEYPKYNSTIVKYSSGHFHVCLRTHTSTTISSSNDVIKFEAKNPSNRRTDVNIKKDENEVYNNILTHQNAIYPPGRIFIESIQQENLKGRPPGSRNIFNNIKSNGTVYDTENRYFPYTTVITDAPNNNEIEKYKFVYKAGVYPLQNEKNLLWSRWHENKFALHSGSGDIFTKINNVVYKNGSTISSANAPNMDDPNTQGDDFILTNKTPQTAEFIIPGGYIAKSVSQRIIEDDTTVLKKYGDNYVVDTDVKQVYIENNNTVRVITDNKVLSMKTDNLQNAYYNLKTTVWLSSTPVDTQNLGRFMIDGNYKTMKDYITLYNTRILSNISTNYTDDDAHLNKNNNSPFPQPQKELIAQSGEIIKFNNNKPNEIVVLRNTNNLKKKYNPYGKRYSPYNEIFTKFSSNTLNKDDSYITLDLGKISTIIGIGCKRKNSIEKNKFTGRCRVGYGYDAPTNTGFLMNYLFNKDKTLFTYDNKKIQVGNYSYQDLDNKVLENDINALNYVDDLRDENYMFLINNYKEEFKNNICITKIQPCVARYIRILPFEEQEGWHDMDYYIMTQEERYYITNDVKIDANSLWIEKTKKEFDEKYNINYDQKQKFSGGGKKVQKGKYIRHKSREGANQNLSNMDNRLYDCPVGTYSDGSLELGEFCKPKTTHCKPSEYLSLSNNQKQDNNCISGYDDINNNIINRKKSYNGTKVPHQSRLLKYNGKDEKNQWWFYNRDDPLNPAYSDFYIEKNNRPYYSTIYNDAEKIVIDGSKNSPLHNKRSYTFTLKSNQICPKKLYNGDGVSNIYLQDSTDSLYKENINKYAEFDIEELSENNGIKTYRITRMDPTPHPNEEAKDIEPPRNLDFKLIFFCNYNSSNKGKFEKIKKRTLKCPAGHKLQLPTSKIIDNKYYSNNNNYSLISKSIGTDYNQKGLYFYIENDNNLYFSNNSNNIVKDVTFNKLNNDIKPSTTTAKKKDVLDLCQKDFGNEWRLATSNEMNSDRISMGAQAWYNSGSPNEPDIRYGYPKNYYAKPDNPWSIANYINESTDEMTAMCIKPDSLEFINHAFQNGWLPDKNGLYKSINTLDTLFSSEDLNTNSVEFLKHFKNVINTKILKISPEYEKYLSDLKSTYNPLRLNNTTEYIIKSKTDLNNSIVVIPAYKSKTNPNSTSLEKAGVRELVSEKSDNTSIIGTKWKLDIIYINNNKNIVANIHSVELPDWDFNNNIYSAQYNDTNIGNNINNINISNTVNNIEFIKTNEPNTYYLKNSSKDEYLYIKNTNNYGENGKSILWHKGILPENIEDKKKFEFEFEIKTDKPNIDLSILYSPFNISHTWGLDKNEYYIQTYKGNNDSNYLTCYNNNVASLGYIRLTQLYKQQSWFIENIKLNNKGSIEMSIKIDWSVSTKNELHKVVYAKAGDTFTLLNNNQNNIRHELIYTGEHNTYYIKNIKSTTSCYLYYDETVKDGHSIYWKFINIPDNDNYKFKFTEKNIIDTLPTATTIHNDDGPFQYTTNDTIFAANKTLRSLDNKPGLAQFYKKDESSSETSSGYVDTDYKQQNYLQNNECIQCEPNEYIDIPNHDFEKCFPKTQCDNNQEYVDYDATSVSKDNNCKQLDYFMFRKKKNTLTEDTSTEENRKGKFVTNINSIIVSLGLIICFWNMKTTYLYLKDEFDLDDIPTINNEIENNSRVLLINELNKKNTMYYEEKKFKWMLLKIFQIQKIWKFDFENINDENSGEGKINTAHSKILEEKDMTEFIGTTTTDKLDSSTLTTPFFNTDVETPIKIHLGARIALYNVHTKKYLSIDKSNTENIIQSEASFKGNTLMNDKWDTSNWGEIFWEVINGGTGVDNDNNNNIKMIGLYNEKHKNLLTNEKISIKTQKVGDDLIENYKRISQSNHILDYNFQHYENARFIIEDAGNGKIKLKTNYINNSGIITSSYLGINNSINSTNYKGYDTYDETYCSFDVVYKNESNNVNKDVVNNTELISDENNVLKLINENNFDTFFNKIFVLEEYVKTLFVNVLYYYYIYYLEGCNNDHLVEFNLENNYTDDSLYKKYIKTNLRTLKTLTKIFDLQDDLYNIAESSNIINNYLADKLVTLHEQCRTDQYLNENAYTGLNLDDVNLNIDGYDNMDDDDKKRLHNSLKSLNNTISINKQQDTKLFRDDVSTDVNDKLNNYDEHKLLCTKNDERYVKCNLIDADAISKLLDNLKTKKNDKAFYNLNNTEFYNYYTELNNLTLTTKAKNRSDINDRIFEVNKLYKLLNKGCRSPISELTVRHADNTYKYTKGNVEFSNLDDDVYQNVNNDIKNLDDEKLNTKQKCYDFISSKDGSNNVDLCCNNTGCIPDCDDYENRDDVKVSDDENITSNLNTYSIDKKYDELYSKTNYNIDRNTAIMEDKYNLTELGCYKDLGTIENYRKFIPTVTEYNNKTGDNYDLNNLEAYGNQSTDLPKILDSNLDTHDYSTQDIIDTKAARNNKTKTLVDNIKYKLDNAHVDYGQTEKQTENIDACLPRINNDYANYSGIRDNSFKLSNDLSDTDKKILKKSYSYDIVNNDDTLNFENASPKYLRDYYNNVNKNINDIKTKQSKLPNKLEYLDSIGCYNETPYREYLVDKHFDDEKLECDTDTLTNNNCIINNYNEEYNKTKYVNTRETLNEEKYIKSYKLCRGENFKNINDEDNDNLVENKIQYHIYYRKKYMNSFTEKNKDRKLKVLKILYYKIKNNKIEDDDKYYNLFFKNNQNDLSVKRNMRLMVEIFRDIINLSEIKYWANLLKVFYVNNKTEYPDDKEYRIQFLKLVYLNLTNEINILEFLHACSFNLKVNLKIFGDKHVTAYVEIRHDIEYDKNIWKKMRAKEMNKLFLNADNIKKNTGDETILNESGFIEYPEESDKIDFSLKA